MGRKKITTPRITIRINPGDKVLLDELAEVQGNTISEICRSWIAEKAAAYRFHMDNSKAVKLMEGFFEKVQDEMLSSGFEPQKVADIFGLGDLGQEEPSSNARHSNTGHRTTKVAVSHPAKGSKKVA